MTFCPVLLNVIALEKNNNNELQDEVKHTQKSNVEV